MPLCRIIVRPDDSTMDLVKRATCLRVGQSLFEEVERDMATVTLAPGGIARMAARSARLVSLAVEVTVRRTGRGIAEEKWLVVVIAGSGFSV